MHTPSNATGTGRVIVACCLALLSGIGLTWWISHVGSKSFTGFLRAKTIVVSAPWNARVADIRVAEGAAVVPGQQIIVLFDEEINAALAEKEPELATRQAELQQAKAKSEVELAWRMKDLESEIFDTRIRSADLLKQQFLSEVKKLAWRDFISGLQRAQHRNRTDSMFQPLAYVDDPTTEAHMQALLEQESAQNAAEVYGAQVELCENRLAELNALKAGLQQMIRQAVGIDVAESNLKRTEAEITRLQQQKAELSLSSPAYGTLKRIRKRPGEHVFAGEPVLEFVDREQISLYVTVPANKIDLVQINGKVHIRFPGNEKRSGTVREILETSPATDAPDAAAPSTTGSLAVRVEPAGKLWPNLPLGTAADVDFTP